MAKGDRKVTISKSYSQKVSFDYQSWAFHTGVTEEVEVQSKEEVVEASDRLFQMAKVLTKKDIKKTMKEIEKEREERE